MKVSERSMIPVHTLLGRDSLAGIAAGKAATSKLLRAAAAAVHPLVLDFHQVELITASAFREAVIPVIEWAAADGRPCFLANVNRVTREEATIAAVQKRVMLLFARTRDDQLRSVEVVGELDEKLATTLRLVLQLKEADAKGVSKASGARTVATAWNNRLVVLARMGLLAERKDGRTKLYSPVAEGMSYGQ